LRHFFEFYQNFFNILNLLILFFLYLIQTSWLISYFPIVLFFINKFKLQSKFIQDYLKAINRIRILFITKGPKYNYILYLLSWLFMSNLTTLCFYDFYSINLIFIIILILILIPFKFNFTLKAKLKSYKLYKGIILSLEIELECFKRAFLLDYKSSCFSLNYYYYFKFKSN
jgi:hypothetical protein